MRGGELSGYMKKTLLFSSRARRLAGGPLHHGQPGQFPSRLFAPSPTRTIPLPSFFHQVQHGQFPSRLFSTKSNTDSSPPVFSHQVQHGQFPSRLFPPSPTRTIPLPSFSTKANPADWHSMKIRCQITVFIVIEYCKQDQNESIGLTPFAVLFYCYQN